MIGCYGNYGASTAQNANMAAGAGGGGMSGGGGGGGVMAIVGGALELGSSIANAVAVGKQSKASLQETVIASQSQERVAAAQLAAAQQQTLAAQWAASAQSAAQGAVRAEPSWVWPAMIVGAAAAGGLAWWATR